MISEELEKYYIQKYDETKKEVQALANFSMIPVSDGQQYSPIIYENYFSMQSYGQFNFMDNRGEPILNPTIQLSFLPIYMTQDSRS